MKSLQTFLLALLLITSFGVPLVHADTGVLGGGTSGTQTSTTGNLGGGTDNTQTNSGSGQNVTLVNPLGAGTSLTTLLSQVLGLVVQLGSIVVILMLVYVGFLFVTAQGNESKIEEARAALLWTIIGALILLGAQAIASGIQATVSSLSS